MHGDVMCAQGHRKVPNLSCTAREEACGPRLLSPPGHSGIRTPIPQTPGEATPSGAQVRLSQRP